MVDLSLYHQLRETAVFLDFGNFNALRPFSLSVIQFDTLRLLSSESGIRMGELCQRLLCDNSKMTRTIDALENRNLVERRADPTDRRAQAVFITDEGKKLREMATAVHNQYLQQKFSALSPEEKEQLLTILPKLRRDI